MITILGGLAWIWWGFIGLLGLLLGAWGAWKVLTERLGAANVGFRDRWLLQHFGEGGRRRWLANRRLLDEHSAWLSEEYCPATMASRRLAAAARARLAIDRNAFDLASGPGVGMVDDSFSSFWYPRDPPWGPDGQPSYAEAHSGPYCHSHGNGVGKAFRDPPHHGEPRGSDWLAAGFWSPLVRDDGVAVDPMSVLGSDMERSFFDHVTGPMMGTIRGGQAMLDEARGRALAADRNGHRTNVGLPRNGWKASVMGA